jgi:hypothetical protein
MLGDEPWDSLRPTVTKLLEDIEQNKQRAAAEFMAGLLGGKCLFNQWHLCQVQSFNCRFKKLACGIAN